VTETITMTENFDVGDDTDERPFTPAERKEIRRLLESQERAEWLWQSVRVWATWISAAVVGAYAMSDAVMKLFKKVTGQ